MCCSQRFILYLLSWSGFLVNFIQRSDLNIAVIAMVHHNNTIRVFCGKNETIKDYKNNLQTWEISEKCIILGSYYLMYSTSQLFGAQAANAVGAKLVFGLSNAITSVVKLTFPVIVDQGFWVIVLMRCFEGFCSGFSWPAVYSLIPVWIPKQERNKFMSLFQGMNVGIAATYVIYGFILKEYPWNLVFYISGIIGIIWSILWFSWASDTPRMNRFITDSEIAFIEENTELTNWYRTTVPWVAIVSSIPVWCIAITNFGRIWINFFFIIFAPTYMDRILDMSIEEIGVASGVPFLFNYLFGVLFTLDAQYLINKCGMKTIHVRKIHTAISQIFPAMTLLMVLLHQCKKIHIFVLFTLSVSFCSAAFVGAMNGTVDLAPHFAGTVTAFCQTIHMLAAFIMPVTIGIITKNGDTIDSWNAVFIFCASVASLTLIPYLVLGKSEVQDWNYFGRVMYEDPQRLITDRIGSSLDAFQARKSSMVQMRGQRSLQEDKPYVSNEQSDGGDKNKGSRFNRRKRLATP